MRVKLLRAIKAEKVIPKCNILLYRRDIFVLFKNDKLKNTLQIYTQESRLFLNK